MTRNQEVHKKKNSAPMSKRKGRKRKNLEEKPEYNTLIPLIQGGNLSSDSFMDAQVGNGGFDNGGEENNDLDMNKGDESNPMWGNLENWWERNMSSS